MPNHDPTSAAVAEPPNPMAPDPFYVRRLKPETDDTFTLALQPADGPSKFNFEPGQFNMVYVFGVGEIPISISGDPGDSKLLFHTTREVGLVTRAMRQLKPNDLVGLRGPFGTFWPVEDAEGKDVVIVAGGIGLAPLRPALYRILSRRDRYGRVVLLYGTRTPADILYRHELEQWRSRFDLEVYATVDRAMSGWRGNVGVVTTLIPRAPFDPRNTVAYVCGPEVMMRFTTQELQKRGVNKDAIFISMERNMKCAVGFCGRCQFGPTFVCKDGPVFRFDKVEDWLMKWEI
ncbi:MAG: FAD/NAD(P)-binding protein [Candidatus Omnitrophica bacterium]|nr:FAD/NAD(P)-binding protein [Candidatus Omnitrophota bacterium]